MGRRQQGVKKQRRQRRRAIVSLAVVLMGCSVLLFFYLNQKLTTATPDKKETVQITKKEVPTSQSERSDKNAESENQTENESDKQKENKNDSEKKKEQSDEQTQYVVAQKTTIYLDNQKQTVREEQIPKGAIITIKEVPGNDQLVEVLTEHNKGFIEKETLVLRTEVQEKREALKNPTLSSEEVAALLDDKIKTFINQNGGDLSIYIETADQSLSYGYQESAVRRTASSIKLAFITYMMTLADQGAINLSEELTYEASDYYGGTGIIQYDPVGSKYSLERLAELVIRYSDNVAYLKLLAYLGEENFVAFLKTMNAESQNDRFFSTAKVLTSYMKYVFENKDSSAHIQKLYGWLQRSTFDDGVAIGVPAVDVIHKTGWMPMYAVSNDIALVEADRPYYVTIMTNGYSEEYSEQAISDLAESIDQCLLQLK
ncbi:beta-lactamase class A [Enterococcus sp. AZ194]|uniref:serine hydrolase n=1 Tax=Enterococcus sp. AZ194 TaxID=2774629 RepID=UPI003F23DE57